MSVYFRIRPTASSAEAMRSDNEFQGEDNVFSLNYPTQLPSAIMYPVFTSSFGSGSAPGLIELVLRWLEANEQLQREGLTISETAMRRRSANKRD